MAYGYLVSRTSELATSESPKSDGKKVGVDEFPGKGSTGQVCRLNGNITDVRLEEGFPQIDNSSLADLPQIVGYFAERTCSVDGTEGSLIGERVSNMEFPPISQSVLKTVQYLDEIVYNPAKDFRTIDVDESMKITMECAKEYANKEWYDELPRRMEMAYERSLVPQGDERFQRTYLQQERLAEKRYSRMRKVLPILGNGSIGMVCWLTDDTVDFRFDKKIKFGSSNITYLEVLPSTTLAPLLLEVCDLFGDGNIVRAFATNGAECLVVGDRVFGFPTSNLEQMDNLKREVASLQKKLRLMKQKEKCGRNTGEL